MPDVNQVFVIVLFERADRLALVKNFARVGLHETGEKTQQGSFARAVGTGQSHQRTGGGFKGKPCK